MLSVRGTFENGIARPDEPVSPRLRRELQARLDAGESFVLLVPAPPERLGWLWAQALLAERIYARSLREQLLDWGWRPQSLTIGEEELAVLARQGFEQDPAAWGGGGLQPDMVLLLEVLAGGLEPTSDHGLILELTIKQAGFPVLDPRNLPGWRARALARLLVTQAHAAAPDLVPATHELLIPASQRAFALELLDRWTDSLRLSKHLPEAILEADRVADLAAQMSGASAGHGPFLSHAAELAVFGAVCTQLAQQSGRALLEAIAASGPDLERHARGFWGSDSHGQQTIPWDELLRLSRVVKMLLEASPQSQWATPATAIEWYVSSGWLVDHAGEELLRKLTRPSPELLALITPLRAAYRARWEGLMIQWSEVWVQAGCPLPPLPTAGEWLREILQSPRATAILIVDAFRFDPREGMQAEHLFKPLPPTVSDDSAFHDRWAAYLPGWEMPKLTNELITDHVVFILDYTSELYHRELRRIGHYGSLWQRWFEAPEGQWSTRDTRSVNRTFSGLTKLIFPSGLMDKEDARLLLQLALELRSPCPSPVAPHEPPGISPDHLLLPRPRDWCSRDGQHRGVGTASGGDRPLIAPHPPTGYNLPRRCGAEAIALCPFLPEEFTP